MQNENQSPKPQPKKWLGLFVTGILLLIPGLVMSRQLWYGQANRWFPAQFELLLIFSPALVVLGGVLLLVALFRIARRLLPVRSAMAVPSRLTVRFEKAWRIFVWVAAVLTIFPWWWLGILTWLSGGRPGNEGEGMGGSLMTIFFGLPLLAVALFNENRIRQSRNKDK